MIELIQVEFLKVFKSKKNKIMFALLLAVIVAFVFYNIYMKNNYLDTFKKQYDNSHMINVSRVQELTTGIKYFNELEELGTGSELIKRYDEIIGNSSDKKDIEKLKEELHHMSRENAYLSNIFINTRNMFNSRDNTEDNLDHLLDLEIRRYENLREAYDKGVLGNLILDINDLDRGIIEREVTRLTAISEKGEKYNYNPYKNTGLYMMDNIFNGIFPLIIFILLTILGMDIFLSENDGGGYKLTYSYPYTRKSILNAKFISMFSILILTVLLILLILGVAGSIVNGFGDISNSNVIDVNTGSFVFSNKENVKFTTVNDIQNIVLKSMLFIITVGMNISLISMIAIISDSESFSIGMEIGLISITLIMRLFIPKDNILHLLNPFTYLFAEDILHFNYNSNYLLGLVINISLTILFYIISRLKFQSKDFLGSVD